MVIIWGTSTCSYCKRALSLCEQYELKSKYILIDTPEKLQELHNIAPGDTHTVPQIWWNNKYIGGFNEFQQEIENTRNFGQEKI